MASVFCPTCDSELAYTDAMVGKKVRCAACQTVFAPEVPAERRADPDDDRPRKRRADPDDERDDDRPRDRRRRDRDDEDDRDRPARPDQSSKRSKVRPGVPGLAMAAGILWLIWGVLGAGLSLLGLVGLFGLLTAGRISAYGLGEALVQTLLVGAAAVFLLKSGLNVVQGTAEELRNRATAALAVSLVFILLNLVRAGVAGNQIGGFTLALVLSVGMISLLLVSGVIVGAILALSSGLKYEQWYEKYGSE